jgi:hypothetical protein
MDSLGIESWWGQDFPHLSRPALGPTHLLYNGYPVFPGGRKQLGRDADPSPPSSVEVEEQSRAIPILSLRIFMACKKGETYLHLLVLSIKLYINAQTKIPLRMSVFKINVFSNKMRLCEGKLSFLLQQF